MEDLMEVVSLAAWLLVIAVAVLVADHWDLVEAWFVRVLS